MGDCLRASKPSRCEACQLGRLSLLPSVEGKMSSNSLTWVTEGGDLGTADWGCLAGRCASLCLQAHTVAVRQAALVSDESALEACLRRCAIQIDDLYLYLLPPSCSKFTTLFWYLNSPTGESVRPIFTLNTTNDAVLHKKCHFIVIK